MDNVAAILWRNGLCLPAGHEFQTKDEALVTAALYLDALDLKSAQRSRQTATLNFENFSQPLV
jgi:hypothetical protein